MIQERYCSLEVSKLFAEKGFDEPIHEFYDSLGKVKYTRIKEGFRLSELGGVHYPHITHQFAMDWLRKKHGILISIIPQEVAVGVTVLCYGIYRIIDNSYYPIHNGQPATPNDYKDVVEAALEFCLTELI